MLSNTEEYKNKVLENIENLSSNNTLPIDHIFYLHLIKRHSQITFNKDIKYIYDIGSSLLHWYKHAKDIFTNSEFVLFDAFEPLDTLYNKNNIEKYFLGLLGDEEKEEVKFYQNDFLIGGNSIYRENTEYFPETNYTLKKMHTLDCIVSKNNYPLPQLIKIDVQGAELNILKGAENTIKNCNYLIIELQHEEYNLGAPKINDTIHYLSSLGFTLITKMFNNGVDGDYLFIKA